MKKTRPKLKNQRTSKFQGTLNRSVSTYGKIPVRIISPTTDWIKITKDDAKPSFSKGKGLFSDSEDSIQINTSYVASKAVIKMPTVRESRGKRARSTKPLSKPIAVRSKKLKVSEKENSPPLKTLTIPTIDYLKDDNSKPVQSTLESNMANETLVINSSLTNRLSFPILQSRQMKNIEVNRGRRKKRRNNSFKITDGISTFTFAEDIPGANDSLTCFQNSVLHGHDDFNANMGNGELSRSVVDLWQICGKIQSTPLVKKVNSTPYSISRTKMEAISFLFPPVPGASCRTTSTPAFLNRTRQQSRLNIMSSPVLKDSNLNVITSDEDEPEPSFSKPDSIRERLSSRSRVLSECQQTEPRQFANIIPVGSKCSKLGEGIYGEVYKCQSAAGHPVAVKVIPIEGSFAVNGEKQKSFSEILPEIVSSSELSSLSFENDTNSGFIRLFRVHCAIGEYPCELIEAWDAFASKKTSDNDRPDMFDDQQLYIVFEYDDGGVDLEHFAFRNAGQTLSVIQQVVSSIALAEHTLLFEHRDLHWGNILVQVCKESKVKVDINGELNTIALHGVQTHIIDFTLSRMSKGKLSLFQDLAEDPDIFTGDADADYQFEIYRMMREELDNEWSQFKPRTNIFWIHYLLDKFIFHVTYKNNRTKLHSKSMKLLRELHKTVLDYHSCLDLYTNSSLFSNKNSNK
nr:uncharacterized protein LOC100184595 [Ciona intestinalis]|eukprot:XP_009861440.1 uncharacterized protein LOC100184595 [Ciona intestinalis]